MIVIMFYVKNVIKKWISGIIIVNIVMVHQRLEFLRHQIMIEISDYDLNEDDRRSKYKDCDLILCEKCDKKYCYCYCYYCYYKETNGLKGLQSDLQPELRDYENFYSKLYDKETKELRELKE